MLDQGNGHMKMRRVNRRRLSLAASLLLLALGSIAGSAGMKAADQPLPDLSRLVPPMKESGYRQIFDGKTLNGWDCDPGFWKVVNGSMVGETTKEHQPKQNTFCIWKGGQPGNFDLRLQYRMTGVNDGNSGVQYRSIERPDVARWVMQGYQADIDLKQVYTGQIYEERGRGFLALRGQLGYIAEGSKPAMMGAVGSNGELRTLIKDNDWNDVEIIARDNVLIQIFNGRVMSALVDDDTKGRKMQGEIGIQLHRLPNAAMKMETRNIRIKEF